MAARINRRHTVQTRRKIQTSQLVNRLQNHVLLGEKMTATQVRTAERLREGWMGGHKKEKEVCQAEYPEEVVNGS